MPDNSKYIRPGLTAKDFSTILSPQDEAKFRLWVSQNKVPFDPNATTPQDYDMRGFYQGLMNGDPHATQGVDPNDKRMHFSDYWKTPLHQTFSNESKFATPDAPHWEGDKLIDNSGKVLFDDKAQNMPSVSQKQHNFFAAAAHDPAFAKRAKIRQSVAREFMRADAMKKKKTGVK